MKNRKNIQLYCDLDGVLVDFEKGVVELGNTLINLVRNQDFVVNFDKENFDNDYEYKFYKLAKKLYDQDKCWKDQYTFSDFESREKGHRAFRDFIYFNISRDYNWWANLGWTKDGKKLWNSIQKYNPIILSSPVGPNSTKGKKIWCENNLGLIGDRVIIVDDKGIETDNLPILIDDRLKSISQIEKVGGIGILHTTGQYQKTLENLNDILNIVKI